MKNDKYKKFSQFNILMLIIIFITFTCILNILSNIDRYIYPYKEQNLINNYNKSPARTAKPVEENAHLNINNTSDIRDKSSIDNHASVLIPIHIEDIVPELKTIQTTYINNYPDFIKKDGTVDDYYLSLASKEVLVIADTFYPALLKYGLTLYITDKNLDNYFFNGSYGSVQGCFHSENNSIYIEDREVACRDAIIHECAHAYDWHMDFLSNTEIFKDLYEREKDAFEKISTKHCTSNTLEYFAETICFYYKKNELLKNTCPETYKYIDNLITNLKEEAHG